MFILDCKLDFHTRFDLLKNIHRYQIQYIHHNNVSTIGYYTCICVNMQLYGWCSSVTAGETEAK